MNAIILSAGLGTRLKPITDSIPKPLLPIVSRPIIDINIQRLINSSIENIGINLFHKADMIKRFLHASSSNLRIIIEKKLRGTGGALLNFKELMKDSIIVHNGDVLSNIKLSEAIAFHRLHKPFATLVLTEHIGTNFFHIDRTYRIIDFAKTDTKNYYTYTGIAILSDKISSFFPEKDVFSIVDVYQRLIDEKQSIIGFPTTEPWCDIGTMHAYWKVHYEIMKRKTSFDGVHVDSPVYIHPTSSVHTENLEGFVSIGANCFLSKDVRLKNTIVFENTHIETGDFERCLLSNEFCIKVQ